MNQDKKQLIDVAEQEVSRIFCDAFGDNLVALLVVGSSAVDDTVEGYSDIDLVLFVKDIRNVPNIDTLSLSKKYDVDIGYAVKLYADFEKRVSGNADATRYVGTLDLLNMKLGGARVLAGENILELIPSVHELLARRSDIAKELLLDYSHATDPDPERNIFQREPKKWVNCIINMSANLLFAKGIAAKKDDIPKRLAEYCPDFRGRSIVEEAITLRKTKNALSLSEAERSRLRENLKFFLEAYREYVSHE